MRPQEVLVRKQILPVKMPTEANDPEVMEPTLQWTWRQAKEFAEEHLEQWFPQEWPTEVLTWFRDLPRQQQVTTNRLTRQYRVWCFAVEAQNLSRTIIPIDKWAKYMGRGQPPKFQQVPYAVRLGRPAPTLVGMPANEMVSLATVMR